MTHTLHLAGESDVDSLLAADPLALLVGMLLDQQVPIETAFAGPRKLALRLGGFEVHRWRTWTRRSSRGSAPRPQPFTATPDRWRTGSRRAAGSSPTPTTAGPQSLAGYGEQKARIFLALLGKQLGVRPEG